jgi:hypothetical protein
MNPKLIELAERRATLVAMAAVQREKMSQLLAFWSRPFRVVDRGRETIRNLARHPAALAWVAAFLVGIGPWRTIKWVQRGWLILRIARMALFAKRSLLGG